VAVGKVLELLQLESSLVVVSRRITVMFLLATALVALPLAVKGFAADQTAESVQLASVQSPLRLEVSLSQRRVMLFRDQRMLKSYLIAVGRAGWETPNGTFKVNQVVRDPVWMNPLTGKIIPAGDPKNPLGRHWIGFLSETNIWYGFHGNNDPDSIGKAVSHGCIRMNNQDVEELMGRVNLGTEVRIMK
jgi:lipoprotein-anchoring transpeptidase ErfK/SrfK